MAESRRIIIDAGHGGQEPGAIYEGRQEKNDTLRLALAVGNILADHGVDVVYTRVTDIYQTPMEKAGIANRSGADYFLSIHRNAMPVPGSASGVETLVYENQGLPALMAENINRQLEQAGFLDNRNDNRFFDQNFGAIANAIAQGVLETMEAEEKGPEYYQVQLASYKEREYAQNLLRQLEQQGFPAFLVADDGLYKVRVGAYLNLDNAARMEQTLRSYGYNTYLVKEAARE